MPNFCINFLNKAAKLLPILYDFTVASLADAWIKTGEWKRGWNRGASHPSRMRGLKSIQEEKQMLIGQSHPSRMRGLKLKYQKISMKADLVAPLTGAWIKTGSIIVARKRMNVASLVDAWIKILCTHRFYE
mgnify:FL=1